MATITFKYVSTRDFAPYYVRLEHKGKRYNAPTRLLVDRSFYNNHYKPFLKLSVKQLQAKKNDANIDKCIEHQEKLEPLQKFLLTEMMQLEDEDYSVSFLKKTIAAYYNSGEQNPERLNLTYWIDYKIDNPDKFKGAKGKIGLSDNTIINVKAFKKKIDEYEEKELKRKLKIKDLSQDGVDAFYDYLTDVLEHKGSFKNNLITDFINVGKIASEIGKVDMPNEFYKIKRPLIEDDESDVDVIYLTKPEIDKIAALELTNPAYINARKWFLLGIYTGQRGGDLLNRVLPNIDLKSKTIRVRQEKTDVKVTIPIHPILKDIIENPPYKITTHTLTPHIKKLGELAGLDEPLEDYKQENVTLKNGKIAKRSVLDTRLKYEYFATHTCRRTFCMMYYNKGMKTSDIMKVSGHKSLNSFLMYINRTDDTHVEKYEQEFANEGNLLTFKTNK